MGVCTEGARGRSQTSPVFVPPRRVRRRETLCGSTNFHISVTIIVLHGILGKSSLGARLRTRKVTGRDASLPAPLLSAFGILVARGTVGALPQTPQGTLSLDPFSRLSWSRFHTPSACSYLVLRLSPCLLPKLSVKNHNYCDSASFSHASSLPESSCPYDHTAAPCKPCCTAHCALS